MAGWLAVCAAAFLPTLPAWAADTADQAEAAPTAGAGPQFGQGKADDPATPSRPSREVPGGNDDALPAGSTASRGEPAAVAAPPTHATRELYGPPAPKSRHGELPQIAWAPAPQVIPPALEQAVRIATKNYPTVSSARASLRAAATDVSAARWLQFPSVSANMTYLDSSKIAKSTRLEPQLVVEVPVWSGGRIESQIRRAKASENVTSARYVETVQSMAMTTVNTYYQIAQLTQREQLLADSIREHHRLVDTMERRVKQEVSPLADLELARSRTAQVEQEYNVTRAQRQSALRLMAELVADPTYDLGPVPFYDPKVAMGDLETIEDEAVAYDPSISRFRATADVARAEMEQTKASILPQLNAQYSYDRIYGNRVGVAVRAQNSGGLSQFSQVQGARLRIDAAMEDARAAEEELRRQVASDIIDYEASRARATISRSASETAANVSASYMRQFIAGRRSWLDVMNALREAVTAQMGRADAEVGAMNAAARMLLRSGRWRPSFAGGGNAPDQPANVPAQDPAGQPADQ